MAYIFTYTQVHGRADGSLAIITLCVFHAWKLYGKSGGGSLQLKHPVEMEGVGERPRERILIFMDWDRR